MRILQPAAALLIGSAMLAPQMVAAQETMNLTRPSPALHSGTTPPAVADPANADKTLDAPVAGRNSFTRKQAQQRIEHHGYANVSNLVKDDNSVWHADAQKGGKNVTVTVDYQGNVTEGHVAQGKTNDQ